MKRLLFNSLALVSLLLCVATGVLWVRSYWAEDVVTHFAPREGVDAMLNWSAWSVNGSCGLWRIFLPSERILLHGPFLQWDSAPAAAVTPIETWYGFGLERADWRTGWIVAVPHWLPVMLLAICPSWWLVLWKRKRTALRMVGCCKACGYDLRATPERCPECGTVPGAEAER